MTPNQKLQCFEDCKTEIKVHVWETYVKFFSKSTKFLNPNVVINAFQDQGWLVSVAIAGIYFLMKALACNFAKRGLYCNCFPVIFWIYRSIKDLWMTVFVVYLLLVKSWMYHFKEPHIPVGQLSSNGRLFKVHIGPVDVDVQLKSNGRNQKGQNSSV